MGLFISPAPSLRSPEQKLSFFKAETMGFLERGAGCPLRVKSCPDGPEVQLPLYPRKRTQVGHRAMSEKCPGCVKTSIRQRCTELFSQFSSPTGVASAIGFRIDEIETDVLQTN